MPGIGPPEPAGRRLRGLLGGDRGHRGGREGGPGEARGVRGLRPAEEEEAGVPRAPVPGGADVLQHQRVQGVRDQGVPQAPVPGRPQLRDGGGGGGEGGRGGGRAVERQVRGGAGLEGREGVREEGAGIVISAEHPDRQSLLIELLYFTFSKKKKKILLKL